MLKRKNILEFINQPYNWGFVELRAADMGDNYFEAALIYIPEHCPCQFAGYVNMEFDGTEEEFLAQYGKPVDVEKFLKDSGPLVFVPKLHNEDDVVDLCESGIWDEFHLDHNEDFISPYSQEVNDAITHRMIELFKIGKNLNAFGMNKNLVDFLTISDTEQEVGSEDELMMALSPFRNSVNKLIEKPIVHSKGFKLTPLNKIEINFALSVPTVFKDEDSIEIHYSAVASINTETKTVRIDEIKDIGTVVLSYNDDEEDFLIYDVCQWFADLYQELRFEYVFDKSVFDAKVKELVKKPVVLEALAKEVFV